MELVEKHIFKEGTDEYKKLDKVMFKVTNNDPEEETKSYGDQLIFDNPVSLRFSLFLNL